MIPVVRSGIAATPLNETKLKQDSNCVLIQDPSAIWGAADHLPRRNLLGYTEDFSNAFWTKGGYTVTTGTTLLETSSTSHALYVATGVINPSTQYVLKARIRGIGRTEGKLTVGTAAFADSFSATFNLSTVSVVAGSTGTGTVTSATIVEDGSFYVITLTGTGKTTTATHYVELDGMVSGSTSYTGDVAKGFELSYLHLTTASTIDQSYQKITDWETEKYAWAAQKNVPWLRRNYTINSRPTTGWTKRVAGDSVVDSVSSPHGQSVLFTPAASSGWHEIYQSSSFGSTTNVSLVFVAIVKSNGYTKCYLRESTSSGDISVFDLSAVSVLYSRNMTGAEITAMGGGWYKLKCVKPAVATNINIGVGILPNSYTTGVESGNWIPDGTSGLYIVDPTIAAADTMPQYIGASWAATYTSLAIAAGYPISMYEDRFGTIATYAPDDTVGIMLDGSEGYALGSELVTNGTFTTDTTGWSATNTNLSVINGQLSATNSGANGRATQTITGTVSGKTYKFSGTLVSATASCFINFGTTSITSLSAGQKEYLFVASGNNVVLELGCGTNGATHVWDNVTIKEIPGYHSTAPSDAARPNLRLDGNGKWYLDRDTSDDNLPITWSTVLSDSQLGPELVTNGGFDDGTGWSSGTGWSIGSGVATASSATGILSKTVSGMVAGKTIVLYATATGTMYVQLRICGTSVGYITFAAGTTSRIFTLTGASSLLEFIGQGVSTTGTLDNISIKEVTGTNVIYTATGDYTTKDSGLILSGATDYKYPQRPSGDYGRIIMAADSRYDAKIIKYLDAKRGRAYLLGPELVTNGGFDSETGWTLSTNHTISGGTLNYAANAARWVEQTYSIVAGKTYYVVYTITSITSGKIRFRPSGSSIGTYRTTTGTFSEIMLTAASGSSWTFETDVVGGFVGSTDNISVREILL